MEKIIFFILRNPNKTRRGLVTDKLFSKASLSFLSEKAKLCRDILSMEKARSQHRCVVIKNGHIRGPSQAPRFAPPPVPPLSEVGRGTVAARRRIPFSGGVS